jgi:hypothetical protein
VEFDVFGGADGGGVEVVWPCSSGIFRFRDACGRVKYIYTIAPNEECTVRAHDFTCSSDIRKDHLSRVAQAFAI